MPLFQSLKVGRAWAGYYDYNTFDCNALLGYHPEVSNLAFCTGFSGHGIQQCPAAGQAAAELIVKGRFESIDLTALSVERVVSGKRMIEKNVV